MSEALNMSAEVIAAIFGIAITVVAIIVQLAATRYNHHIVVLFMRDPTNIAVQTLFILVTLLCIWVAALPESTQSLHLPTLLLVTIAVIILLPYFVYVFLFISPLNIIRRMVRQTTRAVAQRKPVQAFAAVNQIQDVARSAIEHGDRAIALACVDAFQTIFTDYRNARKNLPQHWHEQVRLQQDPDFVSYEPSALNDVSTSKLWFEVKLLQQFLNIMWLATPQMREVAAALGIATRHLSTSSTEPALQTVTHTTMNSLLRASINARDARTAYHLLSQYRSVAEHALEANDPERVKRISQHIARYGLLAYEMDQAFILEVAAFDLSQLVMASLEKDSALSEDLLRRLLDLDQDIRNEAQENSLLGVRRAQIQVAAALLATEATELVTLVVEDLAGEHPERLERIMQNLQLEQDELFWEFTPRGVNFNYLPSSLKPYLAELVRQIAATRSGVA